MSCTHGWFHLGSSPIRFAVFPSILRSGNSDGHSVSLILTFRWIAEESYFWVMFFTDKPRNHLVRKIPPHKTPTGLTSLVDISLSKLSFGYGGTCRWGSGLTQTPACDYLHVWPVKVIDDDRWDQTVNSVHSVWYMQVSVWTVWGLVDSSQKLLCLKISLTESHSGIITFLWFIICFLTQSSTCWAGMTYPPPPPPNRMSKLVQQWHWLHFMLCSLHFQSLSLNINTIKTVKA